MKKLGFGLIILLVAAGFLIRAVFPYYNAFLMDGIVKSIDYNSSTEEAQCIMVDEKTGKIVEFKAVGRRWKIVEVDNCIQVKMYPFMLPTKNADYKMVALEKILNCNTIKNGDHEKKNHTEDQNKPQNEKPQNIESEESNTLDGSKDSLKDSVIESGESVEI